MSGLKVLEFPDRNVQDIPLMLRNLAQRIEEDSYGEVRSLAWVLNRGESVEVGLMGVEGFSQADAHFLLARGAKWLLE